MDSAKAQMIIDAWQGGRGIVPRGPKSLLSVVPALPADVERHTGSRPALGSSGVWRLEVGGRFLASGGVVYPGGVPFPEELHSQTAVISSEVWIYADGDGRVLGCYWWPDAVRRPIAARPSDDFSPSDVVHPGDAAGRFSFPLKAPSEHRLEPVAIVCSSADEAVVFCTDGRMPDPLNELVTLDMGGVTIHQSGRDQTAEIEGLLRSHQPPYRRLKVGRGAGAPSGVGRDPGRSLGPQTWPWPAELSWTQDGVSYEIKGFQPLTDLIELAEHLKTPGAT